MNCPQSILRSPYSQELKRDRQKKERTRHVFCSTPCPKSKPYVVCILFIDPVQNMTRILMTIPSHFMSQLDLVRWRFVIEIDTKFHDYSMSKCLNDIQVLFVICLPCWNMTWILHFTRSSHGISMAFAKKMMGFPSDLMPFLTKLPSIWHEKIHVTFLTGLVSNSLFTKYINTVQYFTVRAKN